MVSNLMNIVQKRRIVEQLIVALIDEILECRGFDGELLFIPQRDITAHNLLRGGRVPTEAVDHLLAAFEGGAIMLLSGEAAASGEECA